MHILEENPVVVDSEVSDSVLHMYCGSCTRERGGPDIAFCGMDLTGEEPWDSWLPSDECVMCVEVKSGFAVRGGWLRCPSGHILRGGLR